MSVSQRSVAATAPEIELNILSSQLVSQQSTSGVEPGHTQDADVPTAAVNSAEPNDTQEAKYAKLKLLSCCICFFVAGLNDGSVGALLPYLIEAYGISTSFVGVMYATSFAGWAVAAIVMPFTTAFMGTRGTLLLGAVLYAFSQALRVWNPPYSLFTITFFFASLAQAFQDATANTFVSSITASYLWLGLIHAMYSLGLLVAPLVANTIALNQPSKWALYYACPLGVGGVNIVMVLVAFFSFDSARRTTARSDAIDGEQLANNRRMDQASQTNRMRRALEDMKETVKVRSVWIISVFFFFYLGATFTIGGWIVVFLSTVRQLPLSSAGYVPTGYYAGVFLGRLLLPYPTHNWLGGEHRMLALYSVINLVLQLIAWLVPSAIATSVAISIMGFFFGPFFASGVQVASEVIPRKVRSNALSLVFVVAQLGASVFPALTGAIAAEKGAGVLQPLAVTLIVLTGMVWLLVPTAPRSRHSDS